MVEAFVVAALLAVAQTDEAEEAEAESAVVAAPAVPNEDEPPPSSNALITEYQIASVNRLDVAGGRTRVSVESNAPAPRLGSFPVRFFVDNTTGPRQVIRFSVNGMVAGSMHTASTSVEVNAGERRVVNLPVAAEMRYGTVDAQGPGLSEHSNASMYFQNTYDPQRVVLSISRPEGFENFIGKKPRYSGANTLVHALPPDEAPAELASYLGYDLVVIPDVATLDALNEAQRRAVEAFVATGGHLLLGGALRTTALFPLLPDGTNGSGLNVRYGFGRLMSVDKGSQVSSLPVFREGYPVSPHGPLPEYERRYNSANIAKELLLPQATAPLGRFLLIIALFTLAIGPGSVWVARRRGPAALLVTIPGTAFVTCALIIGYSLVADGFVVHASTFGFTLLDSKEHRAITHGLTAYYANLAPAKAVYGPGTMLVAPFEDRREKYIADLTWKDGLTLSGDFIPSRTYREWGFTSVEPTRARVVVRQKGDQVFVQNALGLRIDAIVINVGGKYFSGKAIRDGGEEALQAGNTLQWSGNQGSSRFSAVVTQSIGSRALSSGEFLVRATGEGFVPTGGVTTTLNSSEQWVRGGFETAGGAN